MYAHSALGFGHLKEVRSESLPRRSLRIQPTVSYLIAPGSANRLVLVLDLSTSLAIGAIPASTEVEDENDDEDSECHC
jgi:hypothetical protein